MKSSACLLLVLGVTVVAQVIDDAAMNEAEAEPIIKSLMQQGEAEGKEIHVICHTDSCLEVAARMKGVQEKIKVAEGKLKECVTTRKQLEGKFAAAAKLRQEAEMALAKCLTDRKKLEEELRQCAQVDRPAAEKALAQCARERSILEAKLKQCAEVDRPDAEKKLALCAKERSALEKKLAHLIKINKVPEGDVSRRRRVSSSGRRRRRASSSSAASLLQTSTNMEEIQAVRAQLAAKTKEFDDLTEEYDAVVADGEEAFKAVTESQQKQDEAEQKLQELDDLQEQKEGELKVQEDKVTTLSGELDGTLNDVKDTIVKMEEAVDAETQAGVLLEQEREDAGNLLQLQAEQHQLRHELLSKQVEEQSTKLKGHWEQHQELVKVRGEADAGCEQNRAALVEAQGKLDIAKSALATCLKTKKEIKSRLEKVQEARKKAQKGLDACLKAKTQLKAKILDCHTRRDAARGKLKACLDRKKELKGLIDDCHKRRDSARSKLQKCLATKEELKEKIRKLMLRGKPSLVQEDMEAHRAQLEATLTDMKVALKDLEDEDKELDELVDDFHDETAESSKLTQEVVDIGKEEDGALSEIQAQEEDEAAAMNDQEKTNEDLADAATGLQEMEVDMQASENNVKLSEEALKEAGVVP